MLPQIYLDYAATTPVAPSVIDVMARFLGAEGTFANPASRSHMAGWQAEAAVEHARKQVATLINADVREIVWTSGATEANNLAIKGVVEHLKAQGQTSGHIISSATEHKAVLDCVEYLETQGYDITLLRPGLDGRITAELVSKAIREDTVLISVMYVNNETGVINDVEGIAELARAHDCVYHMDAAQGLGKLSIDVASLPVDLISMCAHKIYGPKGIGALYVRRRPGLTVSAQIHGGGHERGMRSGTLATHQIAGMGAACELAQECMEEDQAHYRALKSEFMSALQTQDLVSVNGHEHFTVPNILNLSFEGGDGQLLLSALPNLALSSGSACTSASMSPSHVLKAMGVDDALALSALRISFGRETTIEQVKSAAEQLNAVLSKLLTH